ncbi:hypothetical protein, partial [Ruegeria atlantica]|uniref:hypothetical protein n=1 Tax=Ruegeria atlantica TaxID=81569 RepID=UPI001C2B9F5F
LVLRFLNITVDPFSWGGSVRSQTLMWGIRFICLFVAEADPVGSKELLKHHARLSCLFGDKFWL